MSLLIHIDTAVQTASVCLSLDGQILAVKSNPSPRDSAAWLHPAIHELVQECGYKMQQVQAVSVSAGPGSYTGLRVGMATAKGLCYALHIPLITVGTLQMMAAAAVTQAPRNALLVPMIDARRMEVFTAVYDQQLNEVTAAHNAVLTTETFEDLLTNHELLFFGNGSTKFKSLVQHRNALFAEVDATAQHLVALAVKQLQQNHYADLAYAEPFYSKAFYSPLNPSHGND